MRKKTINVKDIPTDIKGGMDDSGLMGRYGISEKGLQSLFRKIVDVGVLKNYPLEKRRTSCNGRREMPAKAQKNLEPVEALVAVSQGQLQRH